MTVTARTAPAAQSATLTLRPSVTKLSAQELATFRSAIEQALALDDERGYEYFANWHGVTLGYCRHHEDLFLPWHRAYLYYFELALRAVEPTVALPWWDWTVAAEIPAAYTDPEDPSGQPNALLKAPVKPWGPATEFPQETFRKPGAAPAPGPPYDLSYVLAASTYTEFEKRMWAVHDTVHVWVGGTMGDPAWAAYDPLFWAHHTMVDRVWRIWQHSANAQPPPATSLETALEPRGMRVRETLEVRALGYDYAGTASTVPGTVTSRSGAG